VQVRTALARQSAPFVATKMDMDISALMTGDSQSL